MHNFEELVQVISKHDIACELPVLKKAYDVACSAHLGQLRESGEPYITHPLDVAMILADLGLDCTSITVGILHDVLEDSNYTLPQIREMFGNEIAELVDGVTKLEGIPYTTKKEQQVENLRKMFLAMAKDIRVVLVKLADRLHNIRTLKYSDRDKQIKKAQETLDIYAPLAHRLGISKIKWELEDLCLRYIDPQGYYDLVERIARKRREREAYVNAIMEELGTAVKGAGINAEVEGRPKHFYSIYTKMKQQNKPIEEIYDLFALRAVVDNVQDCYAVLGIVHELYKPVPGKFKDYIAMPKPNMYQSLHTIVIGPDGHPVEIQMRTREMHKIAEVGIAAHWKYKEGGIKDSDLDSKLAWLRQLLDWQKYMQDADEFMETLKIDLFMEEVFVFTPKGDVLSLPKKSTPIDFAYAIHSAVGNKMMGAKVNWKLTSLDHILQNGDIVEILTSNSISGPSRDWLKIAKSSQAKNKINQWFRKRNLDEDIAKGKELIEKELKRQGVTYGELFKSEWVDIVLKKYSAKSLENLYSLIGYGAVAQNKVVSRLKEEYRKENKLPELEHETMKEPSRQKNDLKHSSDKGVLVRGVENCLVRLSRCCNPIPGDEIVGHITKGRGVSVHRADCINVRNLDCSLKPKLLQVRWAKDVSKSYITELTIFGNLRPTFLLELTNIIAETKVPVKSINTRTNRKDGIIVANLIMEMPNTEQLTKVIKTVSQIKGVISVSRN